MKSKGYLWVWRTRICFDERTAWAIYKPVCKKLQSRNTDCN